jgi:hypothetical protein
VKIAVSNSDILVIWAVLGVIGKRLLQWAATGRPNRQNGTKKWLACGQPQTPNL